MSLVPEVESVLAVTADQWPSDIGQAIPSFTNIADVVLGLHYDLIINLDTWFMPCFLASILKEAGLNVQGNSINLSINDLFQKISSNSLNSLTSKILINIWLVLIPLWLIGQYRGRTYIQIRHIQNSI